MKKTMQEPLQPPAPYPDPPPHLSARAADLWLRLGPKNAKSVQRQELFRSALECLDRVDRCREEMAASGMTYATKSGTIHAHPLCKVEKDSRALFGKLWMVLGFAHDPHIWDSLGEETK